MEPTNCHQYGSSSGSEGGLVPKSAFEKAKNTCVTYFHSHAQCTVLAAAGQGILKLVSRARFPSVQRQETELWNNPLSGNPVSGFRFQGAYVLIMATKSKSADHFRGATHFSLIKEIRLNREKFLKRTTI